MSLIPEPVPIPDDAEDKEFHYLNQLRQIVSAARNLSFTIRDSAIQNGDKAGNFNGSWVVFTSNSVSNTEDTVTHSLGRVPLGFLACVPNKAATIYVTTNPTATRLYVKTSAPSVAWKLLLF